MNFRGDDVPVDICVLPSETEVGKSKGQALLVLTTRGFGKRVDTDEFKLTRRYVLLLLLCGAVVCFVFRVCVCVFVFYFSFCMFVCQVYVCVIYDVFFFYFLPYYIARSFGKIDEARPRVSDKSHPARAYCFTSGGCMR